jgi:hypothetical protein
MKLFAIVLFAVAAVVSAELEHHQAIDAAAADVVTAFAEGLDEVPPPENSTSEEVEKVS